MLNTEILEDKLNARYQIGRFVVRSKFSEMLNKLNTRFVSKQIEAARETKESRFACEKQKGEKN